MAQNRNPIYVTIPFKDAEDANAKNRRPPRPEDRVGLWGGSGGGEGEFEVVLVDMDNNEPCYREREKATINMSLKSTLGSHPTFIRVRLEWPQQLHGLPNCIMEDDDARQVKAHYGRTPREDGGDKDDDWWSHLGDTHNFLIRLQDCRQPDGAEMMTILRGQAQDLGELFYVPTYHLIIKPDQERELDAKSRALHKDGRYTSFTFCEKTRSELLRRWFTRRFFVSLVEVGEDTGNWVTVIFDRYVNSDIDKLTHLYILDPNVNGRSERANHVIQVWRQVLREIGYPSLFAAFVLPLTNRPHGWTTGYIALFTALQAMRGLSGLNTVQMGMGSKFKVRTRYFLAPGPDEDRPSPAELNKKENRHCLFGGKSELRFRDWCIRIRPTRGGPATNIGQSLDWVLHHLVACAAMELGISKHTAFSTTALRGIRFDLEPLASDIERWSKLDAKDHHTIFGGFNPVCPLFAQQQRFCADYLEVPCVELREHGINGRPLYLLHRRVMGTTAPSAEDCKIKKQ